MIGCARPAAETAGRDDLIRTPVEGVVTREDCSPTFSPGKRAILAAYIAAREFPGRSITYREAFAPPRASRVQHTREAARAERIGAKEAAAILGVKPRNCRRCRRVARYLAPHGSAGNGPTIRRSCTASSNNKRETHAEQAQGAERMLLARQSPLGPR
jgi:hypothetical protein